MIEQLSKERQRQLAVAILAAVVATILLVTVLPIWSANASQRTRIEDIQGQLRELGAELAADAKLRPRFEQLRKSQLSAGHYLKSSTDAVAAAELQRIVKQFTGGSGQMILSTQILPPSQEKDFVRVALKVRMRGALSAIVKSFFDIETNDTFLFIDNVSIRESGRRTLNRNRSNKQFDVDFDLIGYMPGPRNEI